MALKDVTTEIKKAQRIAILCHHNADLDSVCSALVLKDALVAQNKEVLVGAAESVSKNARRIVEGRGVLIDPEVKDFDLIVTVDAASPEQLLPVRPDLSKTVVIDHHQPGALAAGAKAAYVDATSKSSAQLVHAIVKDLGAVVTPEMAALLAAAIISDTNYLRFADIKTFEAVVDLLRASGKEYKDILDLTAEEIDVSERIAILRSTQRLQTYQLGDLLVAFSTVGSFEAAVARSFLKLGADISIVAVPRSGAVRISGRMNSKRQGRLSLVTDVFKPCEAMIGGSAGGHDG